MTLLQAAEEFDQVVVGGLTSSLVSLLSERNYRANFSPRVTGDVPSTPEYCDECGGVVLAGGQGSVVNVGRLWRLPGRLALGRTSSKSGQMNVTAKTSAV